MRVSEEGVKERDKREREISKRGRERAESLALRHRFSVYTLCREANNSVIHS